MVSWARKVTKSYDLTAAYVEKVNEVKGLVPDSWNWMEQGAVSPVKSQV